MDLIWAIIVVACLCLITMIPKQPTTENKKPVVVVEEEKRPVVYIIKPMSERK
ncbi:hypothetical protein [Hydrotalea sp. AMD]|uniref:hypothetical protein n=1 Tax=Hydrotalea sp. AMD TaxID=2501297 RepID=UPI00257FCE5E|nr:hypothetical protein [Hydrotalea sp. AMD]